MNVEAPLASVIVRTRNEEATIEHTLQAIINQSLPPHEIIIVDDNSTDKTLTLAGNHTGKIISLGCAGLPYNHAYACNLGASQATGDIVVLTNGHSVPLSTEWLKNGVSHFTNEQIAGCSGYQYSTQPRSYESLRSKLLTQLIRHGIQGYDRISLIKGVGLFNTVTGAIRKDLWDRHHFDEGFSDWFCGGEDKDWAFYFYKQGYRFFVDPNFSVYHNHQSKGTLKDAFLREFDLLMMYLGAYNRYKRNISTERQESVLIPYARGPYKEG